MIHTAMPTISTVMSSFPSFPSLRRRSSNLSSSSFTTGSTRSSVTYESPITPQSATPRFGPVDSFDNPLKQQQLGSVFNFSHILNVRKVFSQSPPPSRFALPEVQPRAGFGFVGGRTLASNDGDEVFEAGLSILEPRPQGFGCVSIFEVLERW